jgi:chitinase
LGSSRILTLATSPNPNIIPALNFAQLNPLVNWYNIMTYDYTSGSWGDSITGHHSAASKNSNDPLATRKQFSAEDAGELYTALGAQKDKINLGVALYGRGFKIDSD